MRLTEPAYGVLLATVAAGGLVGAMVAERVERRLGRARALVVTTIGSALLSAPAFTADPLLTGTAFFVGGVAVVIWNVIGVSLRQRITPDRLLGRVNSGYRLVAWGSIPLGAAAGGVMAHYVGLRTVFLVMLLLRLAMLAGMRNRDRRADGHGRTHRRSGLNGCVASPTRRRQRLCRSDRCGGSSYQRDPSTSGWGWP